MAVQNLILGSFTRGNQKLAGAMEVKISRTFDAKCEISDKTRNSAH